MARADSELRVTELLASLSLATDLGTGQPMGHGLATSLLAVAVARELECRPEQIRHVQQVSLIRFLGCNADAGGTARMAGGNELNLMAAMSLAHMGSSGETLVALLRTAGAGQTLTTRARLVASALADTDADARSLSEHCEVGAMLARRLGLDQEVVIALQHSYERWNGGGHPGGLKGDEIPLETRIGIVARDVDLFARADRDVTGLLRDRQGKAYDPMIVDVLIGLAQPHRDAEWNEVLGAEPPPIAYVDDIDQALAAVADYVDIKSAWTRGHSRQVADLANDAGRALGMSDQRRRDLRRAALVHDLGRVGVENGIWDKPGPLATGEREKVRLHPYLTERILSRCPALARLGDVASSHHERLDGSGYHRQTTKVQTTEETMILAAADVMAALTADRPHRRQYDLEEAARLMEDEVAAGRLDHEAVTAVITAAGGQTTLVRAANPGSLTDREVEVLRLLARGETNRRIGEALFISPKTVGRHVENIYLKIEVSTRAGAALYAMEHRLLG
ncbi:MAG TPA: HD domain-containing phosphohydrolase [Acidimicrobiia bacterium]|nr:HD domain-containing phosphohydrolase [Acidimicrobiia bacterium]